MSALFDAFQRENPGGSAGNYDHWLEEKTFQHVGVLQDRLGVKNDRWFGPGTLTATLAKLPPLAPPPGPKSDFALRVRTPAMPTNYGLAPCRQSTMIELFGVPGQLSENCTAVSNETIKALLVTQQVHPAFKVTGIKPAVESLARVLAEVQRKMPELHAVIGSAGMLCCRKVRGGVSYSNHSWGTAWDPKIDGIIDTLGDGYTQQGLIILAHAFREEGWFWGAYFSREDSGHMEPSDSLVREWRSERLV
jgi:hypothetical protein